MELNLEAISAFLENNRLADGEKLIEFNGHEISFKPTGSDSIGGEFLGLRSEEQQNVNNRTRDKFLKFVLKLFNATDASKLPAGVRKAMELNDYCGIFGRVRSLTAKGGSSTGKPLSLRRIRVVAQAVRDCRKHAVSQIDQVIARLQAKGFSPETIRGLGPISHAAVMDWTSKSVAALKAVRDAIANGSPQGEINEAIERLYALASNQKQVAKQRRESARQKEERWELDEADQYDMQADFAKSESGILEDQLKELAGLYNVSTSKTVPKNVVRDAGKHAMKRNMHGSYCTAVMVLNRFRYSGRIGDGLAGQFEFGSKMKAESVRGKKDLLLGMLKKIIGLEEDPVLTATKRLFNAQEANRQTVLAEADFEKNDVKPLRISDNQVPMPEYTEKAQDKEEVGKRLEAMVETAVQIEKQLNRRLEETVGQHLMKVGAMNETELAQKLEKVLAPAEFSGLYKNGEMTVLERDLIADILQDYGIRFPDELEKTVVLDLFKSHCEAEKLDPEISLAGHLFIDKEVVHFRRCLKEVNLKESFSKTMLKDLFSKMLSKFEEMRKDAMRDDAMRKDPNYKGEPSVRSKMLSKISYEQLDIPAFRFCMLTVPGFKEFVARHEDKINEIGSELDALEAQFANQLLLALKVDDVENLCRLPPNELQSKIRNEMDAETFVKFCGVVANFDTPEFREGKRVVSDYVFGELSAHLKDVDLAKAVQFMKDKYPGNNSDKIPNARLVLNVISRFIPKEGEENVEYRNRIKAIGTEL